MIGTAGELPKPPSTPVQFLEGKAKFYPGFNTLIMATITDMNESELASAVRAGKR